MSWYEVWLFLHITAAIVWIGGAATIQFFGILTKRAADPVKTVFFARNVSSTVLNVFLPSSVVIFLSGVGLTVNGNWDWGEPFIVFGLVSWAAVSLVAFGYLARARRAAAGQLEAQGPSPALGLRIRNLVWLSRVLLVVLLAIVFMMVVKLGT
jgi:uncharacterized membrane protein